MSLSSCSSQKEMFSSVQRNYESHSEGQGEPLHDHIAVTYEMVCDLAMNAKLPLFSHH